MEKLNWEELRRRRQHTGQTTTRLCASGGLSIMNTFFHHKDIHRYTWYRLGDPPTRKSLIDFFVLSGDLRKNVMDVYMKREADCRPITTWSCANYDWLRQTECKTEQNTMESIGEWDSSTQFCGKCRPKILSLTTKEKRRWNRVVAVSYGNTWSCDRNMWSEAHRTTYRSEEDRLVEWRSPRCCCREESCLQGMDRSANSRNSAEIPPSTR